MKKSLVVNIKQRSEYQPPLLVALLLLLIGTSISIHQFKVPPLMEQVAGSVGISAANAPWLMSIFALVCLVFAVPAGALVQRLRIKRTMLFAAVLVVAGSLLGAISNNAALLLMSRGMEGLGFLLISIAIPVAATTHTDPSKIGFVMGICGVWISTGQILAFNVSPLLVFYADWRWIWLIYGLFTVAALVVLSFGFRSKHPTVAKNDAVATKSIRLWDALKNKNLIFPSVGFLVYNFSLMAVVTFFPGYATETNLMPLPQATFIASLPMIFSLVGSPILGRLTDRFGHKWLYSLSVLCGGVGAALMFSGMIPLIMTGAIILGFIGAATPSLMFSSLGKVVPSMDFLAQSNGIAVLFQNAGMFLATLLFGTLVRGADGSYTLAAMILIPMSVVSVILVLFTHYKENRKTN